MDEEIGTQSKSSFKTKESIIAKANRPSIKATNPDFDVEHVRDSFRFKTVLDSLEQMGPILRRIAESDMEVIKLDVAKLFGPGPWGWRIVTVDLRMPNGQIVEYYFPIKEVEQAKKEGNHLLFEKWRGRDVNDLSQAELEEYANDVAESNKKYQAGWDAFVSRSGLSEAALRADFNQLLKSLPEDMASKLVYESSASGAPQPQESPLKSKETKSSPSPQVTQARPVEGSIDTEVGAAISANIKQPTEIIKDKNAVFNKEFNWFAPMGIELKQKNETNNLPESGSQENQNRTDGLSEDSQGGEERSPEKVKAVRKRIRKADRRIRDPRYRAALAADINNPRHLAMKYFIRGGKIQSDVIKKMFEKSNKEVNARIGLMDNVRGIATIDGVADLLWSDQKFEFGTELFDTPEISNAVGDVLLNFSGTKGMVDEILDVYKVDPEYDADYERMRQEGGEDLESEELDTAANIYERLNDDELNNIATSSQEKVDDIVEGEIEKYKPTQEEIDRGDYDADGNPVILPFQFPRNIIFDQVSSAESAHKTKCRSRG